MTQILLFARHGNTFDPGDRVVWVGQETDLPLVARGRAQAEEAAQSLAKAGLAPDRIYAASLKRTREFAAIVAGSLGLAPPVIDPRLDELDYGAWAGKDNEEIAALGPEAKTAMEAWNTRDVWPAHAGWRSVKAEIMEGLSAFVREIGGERPLVVSSNGILRFLPRLLLSGAGDRESFKMRTGHLGRIDIADGKARLAWWDQGSAQ